MSSTVVMINLLGAVALLLFGLAQVKDGVSQAFGAKLKIGLATGTNSAPRSFFSGLIATIALQSSTATALMTASFVERELIKPRMAQIVLLGANVGTAITAWIVAAGLEWLSPLVILIGLILVRGSSSARQGGGKALVGIGLMLLALHLLSAATEPMRSSPALMAFVALLDNAWPVALIFSAMIAFVSSSSLAAVVLILSLASAGVLSTGLIIVLVLGANLGGAVPPVLASLSGPASVRRVTLGNLIVRGAGCVLVLPLAGYGAELLTMLPLPTAKLPVDAHLAFNVCLAVLAWPFSRAISGITKSLIADDAAAEFGPKYLDEQELSTPVVALASATREVLGIGDLVERMLVRTADSFDRYNPSRLQEVSFLEGRVDLLQQEVKLYLSKLGRAGLNMEDSGRSAAIIDYAINLEHIGDILEKSLVPEIAKKGTLGLQFSEEGHAEVKTLFELTQENIRIAQTIFVTRDFNLARRMMELKVEVRKMEKQSAAKHLARLRDGRADSIRTSSLHLDILRDLKRINAHIVAIAHPILDESGLLIESRLRSAS
ncbi:Na/Pi cotransporter family protein [Agrobacterium rubi]|uniref:Na/Pi cotransporter family protein n=1 Tax=Agrobacterium rubi TaxID=28099 RepID=UPI001572BE7B|nr:Na/Pi cotransporter family protein [Agrobacterium rubi]NTF10699.1 Na/Pi cotransporter family protein [Agrobacterium rubi]NTF23093.1 Na/Pi cotransporter family protein [Agrobacterium rubi]NTF30024.1 Na/Pi cotransporter family protein [Agrobacterium rubi]